MIEYMNKHFSDKYFFKYSTPSEYVDALKNQNISWPTKYDDMMPYSGNPDQFWTGYFTSRANNKDFTRRASQNYHSSSLLYTEKILD